MDLFLALTAAPLVLLSVVRHLRRRRRFSLDSVLAEVEAASALTIADWPRAHMLAHLDLLALERVQRSTSYRRGCHTATSRERDYLVLQRIGHAEERLRAAQELASETPVKTVDNH
jgi:hypothetical protein